MKMTLRENGDIFEKANADWFRAKIPGYEELWAKYIGNNGNATCLPMKDLSPEEADRRIRINHAHYSLAYGAKKLDEAHISIKLLADETDVRETFREQIDHLFLMLVRIDYARDMIKILREELKMSDDIKVADDLKRFYSIRSHIIHGPQLPYNIKDGALYVPQIADSNKRESGWYAKTLWSSVFTKKFVPLVVYCDELSTEFFTFLASFHPKIRNAVEELYTGVHLDCTTTAVASHDKDHGTGNTAFP